MKTRAEDKKFHAKTMTSRKTDRAQKKHPTFSAERGEKRTSGMGRLERMKHGINMHLSSPVKAFFPEE